MEIKNFFLKGFRYKEKKYVFSHCNIDMENFSLSSQLCKFTHLGHFNKESVNTWGMLLDVPTSEITVTFPLDFQ